MALEYPFDIFLKSAYKNTVQLLKKLDVTIYSIKKSKNCPTFKPKYVS